MRASNSIEIKYSKDFFPEEFSSYEKSKPVSDAQIAEILNAPFQTKCALFLRNKKFFGGVFSLSAMNMMLTVEINRSLVNKMLPITNHSQNTHEIIQRLIHAYKIDAAQNLIATITVHLDRDNLPVLQIFTCDFRHIIVPVKKISALAKLTLSELKNYKIDKHGFYVYWPKKDIHLDLESFEIATDNKKFKEFIKKITKERKDFGYIMKRYRKTQGLTQKDFPQIDPRQIRKYENGENYPSYDAVKKIATTFNLTVNDYLNALGELTDKSQ